MGSPTQFPRTLTGSAAAATASATAASEPETKSRAASSTAPMSAASAAAAAPAAGGSVGRMVLPGGRVLSVRVLRPIDYEQSRTELRCHIFVANLFREMDIGAGVESVKQTLNRVTEEQQKIGFYIFRDPGMTTDFFKAYNESLIVQGLATLRGNTETILAQKGTRVKLNKQQLEPKHVAVRLVPDLLGQHVRITTNVEVLPSHALKA